MKDSDAMVGLLTGWLLGKVSQEAGQCMKLFCAEAESPDAFVVTFASGLKLRVTVSEVSP